MNEDELAKCVTENGAPLKVTGNPLDIPEVGAIEYCDGEIYRVDDSGKRRRMQAGDAWLIGDEIYYKKTDGSVIFSKEPLQLGRVNFDYIEDADGKCTSVDGGAMEFSRNLFDEFTKGMGRPLTIPREIVFTGIINDLEKEVMAWRERFPEYSYKQDSGMISYRYSVGVENDEPTDNDLS